MHKQKYGDSISIKKGDEKVNNKQKRAVYKNKRELRSKLPTTKCSHATTTMPEDFLYLYRFREGRDILLQVHSSGC